MIKCPNCGKPLKAQFDLKLGVFYSCSDTGVFLPISITPILYKSSGSNQSFIFFDLDRVRRRAMEKQIIKKVNYAKRCANTMGRR